MIAATPNQLADPAAAGTGLPFISVVVPVRNGEAMIADCVESILACDYPPDRHEILVIDNASTDATAEVVARHPVRLLSEPRRGVSFARNRGIAEGRGDVFAFIDGDCLADPAWLRELARPFEDAEVGCVAGELRHLPGTTLAERQAVRMLGEWQRYAVSSNPPYAITANAAYRREVFEQIGPFDTRMPRAQDVELGLRFSERSPLRLAYAGEAVARHRHRSTQRGFFRQQLGWSYGAGLVAAKYHALDGRPSPPPRLRDVGAQVRGLATRCGCWRSAAASASGSRTPGSASCASSPGTPEPEPECGAARASSAARPTPVAPTAASRIRSLRADALLERRTPR